MSDPLALLNMHEVAAFCRVRLGVVKRLHSSGELPFRQVGRVMVVTRGELEAYLDSRTIGHSATEVPPSFPPRFTLYRFYDEAGVLLYVGITGGGAGRWAQHSRTQPWWLEVATIRVEHLDSLAVLQAAEVAAVAAERPKYNVKLQPR